MLKNAPRGSKVIFIRKNWRIYNNTKNVTRPRCSFIIPILNAERTLRKCLDSILSQDYPNIEIVLIDGGSKDNTMKIAKNYESRYKGIIKVFFKLGPLGDVRRYGIENSSGELIAFWDSDLYIPYNQWLTQAIGIFTNFPNASTLWISNIPPVNAGLIAYAYNWLSWSIMLDFAKKKIGFWGGGCSIFKREAVERVGSITEGIDTGEDYDLARKFTMKGYSIVFYDNPIYHDSHTTLNELLRKDLRRSRNFKKLGIPIITGISTKELLFSYLKIGVFKSLKQLFAMKKLFLSVVPALVFLRLIVYFISYLFYG